MGTIALLFTDIEGSTRLAGELRASWPGVLADHRAIVGGAIGEEGGFVDGTEGDAFFATFSDATTWLNAVTGVVRDTHTGTPEYKVTAVRVERLTAAARPDDPVGLEGQ